MKLRAITLALVAAVLVAAGCGNTEQREAFELAAQKEQQLAPEDAAKVIVEYQHVIAMEPGSRWARKAEERIHAVQARVKAEEHRKAIFQEHGID